MYPSLADFRCAKYFYRNHGVAGMYMGFHSLLWGHIVGNVSFFTVYSLIQHSIKPGYIPPPHTHAYHGCAHA